MYKLKILCLTTLSEPGLSVLKNWILSRVILHGYFTPELVELASIHLRFTDSPDIYPGNLYSNNGQDNIAPADALILLCDQGVCKNSWPLNSFLASSPELAHTTAGILTCAAGSWQGDSEIELFKTALRKLKAVVINQDIHIPFFNPSSIGSAKRTNNVLNNDIRLLLDHMLWWAEGLKPVRIC